MQKCFSRLKHSLINMSMRSTRTIRLLSQLYTLNTRLRSDHGSRKVDWFPDRKRSKNGSQLRLRPVPANTSTSLFRCIPSVTKYLLSRNGVGGQGTVTVQGFLFGKPIAGRSVWNTSCYGINLDSIANPLAIASNSEGP